MQTTAIELAKYARQTAADNDCDYQTAVRMMRDEPGEVARDCQLDIAEVVAWCESERS